VKATPIVPAVAPDTFAVLDASHRDALSHLNQLTDLVSRLQVSDLAEPLRRAARELIAFFSGPAREHNADEERHVFPTLQQCDDVEVKRAAECLREDHAWIELHWLDIETQLMAAAEGSTSFDHRILQTASEVFVALMRDHIALEESLLYPQLRGRLKSAVARSVSREMAARLVH
jgi:iron-sulfur cluster repair protein YtfE (RIC family)